ncbi:MAG: hypothetical protein K6T30_03410 [Alicyclobacillus sp.]|nr:hypothetical protein [Alicyclobacillus sp.]
MRKHVNGDSVPVKDLHAPLPGVPVYMHRSAMPDRACWIPKLEAFVPQYVRHHGNLCFVALEDGAFYTGQRVSWLFRSVASYYLINPDDLRRQYILCHNKSQSIPLVVWPRQTVFFAVKVRSVRAEHKNDGAMGYVANTRIERVLPLSERSVRMRLKSGFELDLLMSEQHVRTQRRLAETFELYLARQGMVPGRPDGFSTPLR